ncbi:MAG: hypothetical protein U5J64_05935 [Halobacteriales archaeon]|nr:hypothetical protein [Halobacteriales archaeon]
MTDEDVREASPRRCVSWPGKLEGVKMPTVVEDSHGGVPVALPDDSPDWRSEGVSG